MNTNKILLGGIVGGVTCFLIGWVVYGMLLMDYMKANTEQSFMKPMEQMTWWAMILSNFAYGFLYAYVFSRSNITSAGEGAKTAAIIGLLITLSFDLGFYAMSTMYLNMTVLCVDVIASTVMSAITGAVIAAVMGSGKKAVAA